MGNPLVSIIIRTKNEERWISSCLRAVYSQTYKNVEVIVVDNNSTDQTIKKAKQFPVKVVTIDDFLPGKAINDGIRASTGDVLVCLSGHCVPVNNNWLQELITDLEDETVAGVYGRQEPLSYSSNFDKRDLIIVFGLDKKVQIKDSFFHNANSAFRRAVWEKFPFDEEITNIEDRLWGGQVIAADVGALAAHGDARGLHAALTAEVEEGLDHGGAVALQEGDPWRGEGGLQVDGARLFSKARLFHNRLTLLHAHRREHAPGEALVVGVVTRKEVVAKRDQDEKGDPDSGEDAHGEEALGRVGAAAGGRVQGALGCAVGGLSHRWFFRLQYCRNRSEAIGKFTACAWA